MPLYQHKRRPEWGYASVIDTGDDRTTFGFDDGSMRTILQGHIHLMSLVKLDELEAIEVSNRIAKHWTPRPLAATTAKRAAKPASRRTSASKRSQETAVLPPAAKE